MSAARPALRTRYLCSQCLLRQFRQRPYTTRSDSSGSSSSSGTSASSPPPSGAAKLTTRRLISLHGQDAPKFLQGLITANVRPESRAGLYAAFLNAQGKVLNDAFIYPTLGSQWHNEVNGDGEQGYLIEVDGEQAEALLKHLKRHKLRSKFKMRLLDEGELDVWSVWKEDERWTPHTQASSATSEDNGTISMTDSRAPGMGQRLLLSSSISRDHLHESLDGVTETALEAYTIRRYLKGVAEGQIEIPREDSLPLNCNIDIMGGIDFKKGCYVGQELTIRTHHTGVVRRRILPVALYDLSHPLPETLEYNSTHSLPIPDKDTDIKRDDKRKRSTGKFIAAAGNVGLAMCRLEQMSDLRVSGEGSSFTDGDRFLVQGPGDVEMGVKAFVPGWMRGQIREPKVQKRVQ